MAIWWIDPHTTVQGTGSYASPWSFQSVARTGIADGDEVRIKAVELTSLLTATEYTATYTSWYQLTITAGGSLGADFANNDIVYLPQEDVFVKIQRSGDVISVNSAGMLPWYNTSTGQTTIQVRKVDLASYPGIDVATATILASSAVSNVTVTDGWVSETVRVTDGSAKSIINNATTGAFGFYPAGTNSNLEHSGTGVVIDMPNTAIFQGNSATGSLTFFVYASNLTIDIGQLQTSASAGILVFGSFSRTSNYVSLRIKHTIAFARVLSTNTSYANYLTIELNNVSNATTGSGILGGTSYNYMTSILNLTLIIGKAVGRTCQQLTLYSHVSPTESLTLEFNGVMDVYNSNQGLVGLIWAVSEVDISFGADFKYYHNRRTVLQTSVLAALNSSAPALNTSGVRVFLCDPPPAPPGWTISSNTVAFSLIGYNSTLSSQSSRPFTITLSSPLPTSNTAPFSTYYSRPTNTLITFRDNVTEPLEVLGIRGSSASTTYPSSQFPIVFRDSTTFRTAGPSLLSTLSTRNSQLWVYYNANTKPRATKVIAIPIKAGNSYNIEGYSRTDISTYELGDCNFSIYLEDELLDSQDITTASINSWEQFSLSFVASQTAEAYLTWNMFYAAAGKYWLDDLGISVS